eukprot:gene21388-27419_t
MNRKQNSLLQKHVSRLEAIMEDGLTYLGAFTKVGFLSNLMGTRHVQKFTELDSDLTTCTNQLAIALQLTQLVDQAETYKVVCDIASKIDNQYGGLKNVHGNPALLRSLADELGADVEDLQLEIGESLARIEETVQQVDENVRIIKDAMLDFADLKSDIKHIIDQKQQCDDLLVAALHTNKDAPVIDRSRVLGKGSFGVIYAAEYMNETVAVKMILTSQMNSDALSEINKEVLMHSKVCHLPGVVKMHGANLMTEPRYIILERADCSLHDALHHLTPHIDLSMTSKIALLVQISAALEYIHQLDFIHRDIKSSNVLLFLQSRGRVVAKLSDFGLAKSSNDNTFKLSHTPKGSPPYMSPEAFQGRYSYSSDVYSFTVMMNELLTEERPFAELNSAQEIWFAVIDGKRPHVYESESSNLVGCKMECLVSIGWANDEAQRVNFHKLHKELSDLLKLSVDVAKHGTSTTLPLFEYPASNSCATVSGDGTLAGRVSMSHLTADAAIKELHSWLSKKCGLLPNDAKAIARTLVNIKKITSLESLVHELSRDEHMLSVELNIPRAYEHKIIDMLRSAFTKPLAALTVDEVLVMLESIHMHRFKPHVVTNDITGIVLASFETCEELLEMGIPTKAHAKTLLIEIAKWKADGIQIELLRKGNQRMALPPASSATPHAIHSLLAASDSVDREDSVSVKAVAVSAKNSKHSSVASVGMATAVVIGGDSFDSQEGSPFRNNKHSRNNRSNPDMKTQSDLPVKKTRQRSQSTSVFHYGGSSSPLQSQSQSRKGPLSIVVENEDDYSPYEAETADNSFNSGKYQMSSKQQLIRTGVTRQDSSSNKIRSTTQTQAQTAALLAANNNIARSNQECVAKSVIVEVLSQLNSAVAYFQPLACQQVIATLSAHGAECESIAEIGLFAVGKLAHSHDENRVYQSSLHACELVISLLQRHGVKNPSFADNAIYAVANLTFNNTENASIFGNTEGVCETLLTLMKLHGKSMVSVANCGLTTIANLTYSEENRCKLGALSGCEILMSLLQFHGLDNSVIALCGLTCVANMAYSHAENKSLLGALGVCELVTQLVARHGEHVMALADNALYAIAIVSDGNAKNTAKLATPQLCTQLVRLLDLYGLSNVNIAKYGLHCVNVLAAHSRRTNKLFTQTTICATLLALLHTYASSVYCNHAIVSKIVTAVDSLRSSGGVTMRKQLISCDLRLHLLHKVADNHVYTDGEVKARARELGKRLKHKRKRRFWLF